MENSQLAVLTATLAPDAQVVQGKQYVEITLSPADLYPVAERLKNNSETAIDMLVSVTGMDHGTDLGTVYHLRSTVHNHMIVLKTRVPDRDNPEIDSLCALWPAAEFHEREAYDLLGIRFRNHPDLRRLFLDSTWGYPLRKDYKDDVNILAK